VRTNQLFVKESAFSKFQVFCSSLFSFTRVGGHAFYSRIQHCAERFMSGEEEQLQNILWWFQKAGVSAVMANLPEMTGQSSGAGKVKEAAEELL